MKINYKGIGVPEDVNHYFILDITKENIHIYDTFNNSYTKTKKASINSIQWNIIKDHIIENIKDFTKENKYKYYRFKLGSNIINKLLGKEITLLFWGIESTEDKNNIESALRNWKGLSREERWYLFTMTNANLEKEFNKGWRGAIKKILIEN